VIWEQRDFCLFDSYVCMCVSVSYISVMFFVRGVVWNVKLAGTCEYKQTQSGFVLYGPCWLCGVLVCSLLFDRLNEVHQHFDAISGRHIF
jgi:hypothetical protein